MSALVALVAAGLAGVSGLIASLTPAGSRAGDRVFLAGILLGSLFGMGAGAVTLGTGGTSTILHAWAIPGGAFSIELDALGAVFLIQVFLVGGVGAAFGSSYWPASEHPDSAARLRTAFGLMLGGMALLVIARNAVLFLAGWEVMAIAGFVAITTEDHDPEVRDSGFVYLVATRVGTLCLIAAFGLLHAATGSFSLQGPNLDPSAPLGTAVFLLAFIGFGLKAGVMPLHLWLPGAHANAPSHVSAVMSGVLIKMGVYGLLRLGTWYSTIPVWWGLLVLGVGAFSSVLGVAFALGQHDLKRLLAYHSVENIGIIVMAYGVALVGRATNQPAMVVLGLSGAVLHVFNHGLFKALLFLAAGATIHAAGTRNMDDLGGLLKRMPWVASAFLVGAVAICGLPPLNGFVSEFLVYLSMLTATTSVDGALGVTISIGVPLLALTGALAVACFAKVFGIVYLGEPRSNHGREAHEAPWTQLVPMGVLATGCVVIGVLPGPLATLLDRVVWAWLGQVPAPVHSLVPIPPLAWANGLLVIGVILLGLLVRKAVTQAPREPTWDCGYSSPTARMQYTASSFAAEIVNLFKVALHPRRHAPRLEAFFPESSHFHSHVPEVVLDRVVKPLSTILTRWSALLLRIQQGRAQLYVAYVLLTLLALLIIWR